MTWRSYVAAKEKISSKLMKRELATARTSRDVTLSNFETSSLLGVIFK